MSSDKYVIGVDYGTLSGRALLVRVRDGAELATAEHKYSHAVVEDTLPSSGAKLPPDWALQIPSDYIDVLKVTIPQVLEISGIDSNDVIGIATDFTACTVLPVTEDGTPLSELPKFKDNPHAYVKLWKHHSAQPHADRINDLAHSRKERWISRYGGKISSEWEFAKALQLLEESPEVYEAMRYWVEAADWIVWQLCGRYTRNICTAGYKGIYQDGSYPSREYLSALNPQFADFIAEKLDHQLGELGDKAGALSLEAAAWTGLPAGIAVAVGNVDAHVTAAAANAVNPGQMVAIMGTSTCHVMVSDVLEEVPGMCGVVAGGIVSGKLGYEAGQSGVGDIFGWFANNYASAEYQEKAKSEGVDIHTYLSNLSAEQPVGAHGLIALDWQSGNRSTLVDHQLSGLIIGMTLSTRPEEIYRAIVESTAFGARKIVETFNSSKVPVKEFIAAGGLTKNKFVLQIYADVLNMPITIIKSQQGPALGSAIHAAVAAGAYKDIIEASAAMGGVAEDRYIPNSENAAIYNELYKRYDTLYEEFGHNSMMHDLRDIRDRALLKGRNHG
ncbi:AraB Ribulose kinase [Candidatus Nanopelagicaceae bacterium]